MRKHFVDQIRWLTVLLVLVYHVIYLFSAVGVPGTLGAAKDIRALNALLYFVYPWFMALLFVVAGISARYALCRRSVTQFMKERSVKLLIPSTLGLFVFHWITGYLNIQIGGGLAYIPSALLYPVCAISGVGPLWFIQTLFLFSALLVLVRKLDPADRLWKLGGKANLGALLLLVLPVWGAAQLLNMPLLTVYRFGLYGLMYLLGYFVFSHDSIQDRLERARFPLLAATLCLGVGYVAVYFGTDYTSAACLQGFFTNAYLWIAVLAILGCGKAWLNFETSFTKFMAGRSFGYYILHYPITLVAGYMLTRYGRLPLALNYGITLAAALALTPLLYEVIRSIPGLRFLILGVAKRGKGQV